MFRRISRGRVRSVGCVGHWSRGVEVGGVDIVLNGIRGVVC